MASPVYSSNLAHSPTLSTPSSLPSAPKRRSTDMPTSAPSIKRRKASTSSHPLRQTSFPPETLTSFSRSTRSPSIDDSMSMISGTTSAVGSKKRKRKSKAVDNEDTSSLVNGKGTKSVDGAGRKKRGATRELSVEEDDEVNEMALTTQNDTAEERQKENAQKAMLTAQFDPDQFERFETWRAAKLVESTVRRIVNQTISQSAPQSVVLAVKSVARVYALDLIGSAVRVQKEWIENGTDKQCSYPGLSQLETPEGQEPRKEVARAPLLPDHLREALRRHRSARDGGLAGHLNLHHNQASSGVERFGTRFGGKMMLR